MLALKVWSVFIGGLLLVQIGSAYVHKQDVCRGNLTEFREKVTRGTETLFNTGVVSNDLKETLGRMDLKNLMVYNPQEFINSELICTACEIFVGQILEKRRHRDFTKEEIFTLVRDACVNLGLYEEPVCSGAIHINMDIFLYIIDNNENVNNQRFCATVLQGSKCPDTYYPKWEVEIHSGKTVQPKPGNGEALNILHITDVHYDPLYQEGTLANCPHPVCCQYDSGDVHSEKDRAGYWTEYSDCDVPDYLLDDTFNQIANTHDLDYVYYTGDIMSHRVWATDIYNNTEDMKYVFNSFRHYFKDIPVFPVLGNHEPHPLNIWAPNDVEQSLSTKWVFDVVAEEWAHWLGEETKATIKEGGYYTVLVKPGFRVIGMNSNIAYIMNWWLMYDDNDNYGQLKWLEQVLYDAEQNGESVHILSHIPSGDSTAYNKWWAQFFRIFLRYRNTITGIFNGHTHYDEMIVYHDENDEPINVVAYNGGSLTPFSNKNPNYRIVKVDSGNFDVLDYDQYIFDVTEANMDKTKSPRWFKHYSFKEAYGVDSLLGKDVSQLTKDMATEPEKTLLKQYIRFRDRGGPQSNQKCDEDCMKNHLCNLVVHVHGEDKYCKKLMEIWQYNPEA